MAVRSKKAKGILKKSEKDIQKRFFLNVEMGI
jgi:hypothetical protein